MVDLCFLLIWWDMIGSFNIIVIILDVEKRKIIYFIFIINYFIECVFMKKVFILMLVLLWIVSVWIFIYIVGVVIVIFDVYYRVWNVCFICFYVWMVV